MIRSVIVDSKGSGIGASVSSEGNLNVASCIPDIRPYGSPNKYSYLSQLMQNSSLSTNLNVNGSTTNVRFNITSSDDYDIYINVISILIADSAIAHDNFGALSALTNGIDLIIYENGIFTNILTSAKTIGHIIAQAGAMNPFGADLTSWELANWTGSSDASIITIPLYKYIPGGLRLGRGNTDEVYLLVRDNLTGLDLFNVRCIGYKHYP